MYVVGHKHVPIALRQEKPRSWDVYTGLERRRGAYRAPDYDRYARQVGLQIRAERQVPSLYMGVEVDEAEGNLARISRVLPDSPAEDAGFDRGDVVIAFGDRRITFDNFEGEFRRRKLGETIEITVARRQDILQLELTPGEIQVEIWMIGETPSTTPEQRELQRLWVGKLN